MTRFNTACLALVLAAGALLSGCGGSPSTKADPTTASAQKYVQVTGAFGSKPTIKIDSPLKLATSSSWTTVKGSGDAVETDKLMLIQLTLADAKTGKTAVSTYDSGQTALASKPSDGQLFPALLSALTGKKVGSRVVLAASGKDAYGSKGATQFGIAANDPVVMVADVLAVAPSDVLSGPKGTAVKPSAAAPTVKLKDGKPVGFDFKNLPKVKKVTVVYLTKGTGPKLKNPSIGTFNYLGSVWGSSKVFDESFTKTPISFAVGIHQVIAAWDQALVGVPQGSRILILTPPGPAYGPQGQPPTIGKNATLAFVVDVLGVS